MAQAVGQIMSPTGRPSSPFSGWPFSPAGSPSPSDSSQRRASATSFPPPEQRDALPDAEYDRLVRMDLSHALKQLRAQNDRLTRALEMERERTKQVQAELDTERSAGKNGDSLSPPRPRPRPLSLLGSSPSPEKSLFKDRTYRRSLAFDTGLHHRNIQSDSGDSLQATLGMHQPRELEAQLAASKDELRTTKSRLEESEQQNSELVAKVSILERTLSEVINSSAQALEVDRSLRQDVEDRLASALSGNSQLAAENRSLRRKLDSCAAVARASTSMNHSDPSRRPKPLLLSKLAAVPSATRFAQVSEPSLAPDMLSYSESSESSTDSTRTLLTPPFSPEKLVGPSHSLTPPSQIQYLKGPHSAILRATLAPQIGYHARAMKSTSSLKLHSVNISADNGLSDLRNLGLPPAGEMSKGHSGDAEVILSRFGSSIGPFTLV
ncbi:hypothetical protein DL96DRAFT_1577603 [Flagelloscypha sp. PMI_526]|nr:hypothetical protein DL96DRAFT_1577603 [Flagelloscypha sp. PMI_526]